MNKTIVDLSESFELNKPWDFGPHALLSQNDLDFLARVLECRICRIRHVYHTLACRELLIKPHDDTWEPLGPKHHFHQLSRLIKAVLVATKRQRILYRSGGSLSSCVAPISGFLPPRRSRVRRWICNNHATDIFRYMFYAADDAVDHRQIHEVSVVRPAKWVSVIFPEGQTEFYTKGLSKFEKASISHLSTSRTVPNFLSHTADFAPPICGLMLILGTEGFANSASGKFYSKADIEDANRRWNEGYSNLDTPKHVEKCGKLVRFPKYSPVTRVHHLITYGTASRLLREDRTWEFHYLDRLREGCFEGEDEESEVEVVEIPNAVDLVEIASNATIGNSDNKHCSTDEALVSLSLEMVVSHTNEVMMDVTRKVSCRRRRRRSNKNISCLSRQESSSCNTSGSLKMVPHQHYLKTHLISGKLFLDSSSSKSNEPKTSNGFFDGFCL